MNKLIKVAFDYQIFIRQRFGGISRVFSEVNARLEQNNVQVTYPVIFSQNYYFENLIHTSKIAAKSKILNYVLRIINKVYFIVYIIRNQNCNIIHATYYSSYFYHFMSHKIKYVLTVHDCTQELCSRNTLGNRRMRYLKKKAINRADAIIVPSENTKKDVISLYKIQQEKIHVVYWGCTRKQINMNNVHIKLPNKYIVYVGARNDYKNYDNFVIAMEKVCMKTPELKVVCVGAGFSKEERNSLEEHRLAEKFIQIKANDDELGYIYENAICFVYPSKYEGFGIPILEAFSRGCPVLLSNTSCFPEIGGDSAVYFNPYDTNEMAKCIYEILKDEKRREQLRQLGLQRAKEFTWEKTAMDVYQIYESLLEHPST